MYKLISKPEWIIDTMQHVFRLEDNAVIPFSPENTDYQEYLKWLAEVNEPLPADE